VNTTSEDNAGDATNSRLGGFATALVERLKAIGDRYARYRETGRKADKAFFDDLGGQ